MPGNLLRLSLLKCIFKSESNISLVAPSRFSNMSLSFSRYENSLLFFPHLSPLIRFFHFGFFSEETIVYSVPFSFNNKNLGIQFSCRGMSLKDDSMKIERSANKIILEGLPIADVNHPRLPYDYFDEIIKRIGDINLSKDLLSKIFQFNISMRKKIIDESHLIENEVSKILIKVMHYEISLISSHK